MKSKLLNLFFLASIFLFYFTLPIDTDLGWHLRYGKHLWETASVLKENTIGFYLSSYQWVHPYSLHQLFTYLTFQTFGFWGLAVIGSLVMSATFFLIIKTVSEKNSSIYLSLLLLMFFAQPVTSLGLRSQLFSLLGVVLMYSFILKTKNFTIKNLFLLAVIFTLWVNLHGGFILGIILLILKLTEIILRKETKKWVLTAVAVSFFATLINPFGLKIYPEVYRHFWYPLGEIIAEWTTPPRLYLAVIFTIISFVFVSLITKTKFKKILKQENFIFLTLSWLAFLYLSVKATRNLPFFAIASLFLLDKIFIRKTLRSGFKNITGVLLALILISYRIINFQNFSGGWEIICRESKWKQPCQAVDFLKKNPAVCKNIFNTYEWGGFLAWHLPDRKIFVDGRMPAWPTPENKSPYLVYLEILQTQPGFNEKLEQYKTDCLFIMPNTFMDLELKSGKKYPWEKIYEDQLSVIYQKQK